MKGIQPLLNNIFYFIEIPCSHLLCYIMKNKLMSNGDKIKYPKYHHLNICYIRIL